MEHKCAKGYVGGFVERLREGTYLAHVTEHLCLETQRISGYDIKHGKARQVEDENIYPYSYFYSIHIKFHSNMYKILNNYFPKSKTSNTIRKGRRIDYEN